MILTWLDFRSRYLEVVREIGFAEQMRERVRGDCVVRIARSLVELLSQHLPPALPMTVLYPRTGT